MIDTTHFKEKLEKEAQTIEKEISAIGLTDEDRDRADETEVADDIEQIENSTAVLNQLHTRLQEVKTALQKIETGTYGVCEVSGEPIEEDRLEANPAATTCKLHMNM